MKRVRRLCGARRQPVDDVRADEPDDLRRRGCGLNTEAGQLHSGCESASGALPQTLFTCLEVHKREGQGRGGREQVETARAKIFNRDREGP